MREFDFIEEIEELGIKLNIYKIVDGNAELHFQNQYIGLSMYKEDGEWYSYFDNRIKPISEEKWFDLVDNPEKVEKLINDLTLMKNWGKSLKEQLKPIFKKHNLGELK